MQRALTVCQPFASLIIGWPGMREAVRKLTENRKWRTAVRGPLLIHAGQSRDWLDQYRGPEPDPMPFGAILGRVELVDCVRPHQIAKRAGLKYLRNHQHVGGPWCFVLRRPERFPEPIPYRGQQGFFDVPDDVLQGI